ncbi:hypothetical protein KFE25_003550 [Diacronema lutheri]|uniref:von Hippel-Lindau disease tumour suppressor beta domain-containing protein n=1 Tax=Diacronema lutheri TaxID=2081491 RepID=A0A8J5XI27_DIALT|nr:hypothetical protein KFE25_003550 [Diacronema lutheri]
MKLRSTRVVRQGKTPLLPDAERACQRLRCARQIVAVDHPFFAKAVRVRGIPVRAAKCVEDAALVVAADRLSRQLAGLPDSVIERLLTLDAAVHVIGRGQVTSDLPEHAHMKGVDGGYTAEAGVTVDQRSRGMGGLKSSCGEENLLNIDDDPCYRGRDILTHEFAHAIMDYGLPAAAVHTIRETHAAAVAAGLWTRADGSRAYAGSNASEYWAELSMWYFGSHGEFVDGGARTPAPGPAGLARYDPAGFALLGALYDGSHGAYAREAAAGAQPSRALSPLAPGAPDELRRSVGVDGAPSKLVLRNGSGRDAVLVWVDSTGGEHEYGVIPALGIQVQHTYVGHVWRIAPKPLAAAPAAHSAPAPAPALPELLVRAEEGTCVVELWADGCGRAGARRPRPRGGRRKHDSSPTE